MFEGVEKEFGLGEGKGVEGGRACVFVNLCGALRRVECDGVRRLIVSRLGVEVFVKVKDSNFATVEYFF